MKLTVRKLLPHFDWISFVTMLILVSLGLIMLYSIALGSDDPQDYLNFQKQLLFAGVSMIAYFVVAFFFDYRFFKKIAVWIGFVGIVILGALFFFGTQIRGTTGWFVIGPFSLQPVEFVKLIVVIVLAWYFNYYGKFLHHLKYFLLSGVIIGIFAGLVLMQPDFGSAMILIAVWGVLVLLSGIRWQYIVTLATVAIGSVIWLWFFVFEEFQKNRVRVFLDPSLDPLGVGYNVTQAIIAVGSGRFFGRGLSFGSQSKLKFLPEAQTDFIFAVIAEQLGFVGVVVLSFLFLILFWRMIRIAQEARDVFATYVVVGIFTLLFVQIIINMGMNIGIVPVTGLPLPLISYGGSSLLATVLMLAVVQGIAMRASKH